MAVLYDLRAQEKAVAPAAESVMRLLLLRVRDAPTNILSSEVNLSMV